jgi:hypothetical protein
MHRFDDFAAVDLHDGAVTTGVAQEARPMSRSRATGGPVAGPGRMKGYTYIGSFTVHGELVVADRCYAKSTRPDLAQRFRAKRGVWHAWSRSSSGKYRQVKLVVAAHERHLALAKKGWHRRDDVPRVGADVPVESGNVGVVDAQRLDADEVFAAMVDDAYGTGEPEQLLDGSGCATHTGMGDGLYPLGVETSRGVAVAVQIGFFFDDDDDDDAPKATVRQGAVTDTLEADTVFDDAPCPSPPAVAAR